MACRPASPEPLFGLPPQLFMEKLVQLSAVLGLGRLVWVYSMLFVLPLLLMASSPDLGSTVYRQNRLHSSGPQSTAAGNHAVPWEPLHSSACSIRQAQCSWSLKQPRAQQLFTRWLQLLLVINAVGAVCLTFLVLTL